MYNMSTAPYVNSRICQQSASNGFKYNEMDYNKATTKNEVEVWFCQYLK